MDTHVPTNLLRMVDTDTPADTGLPDYGIQADSEKNTIRVVLPVTEQKDSALRFGRLLDVRLPDGRREQQYRNL